MDSFVAINIFDSKGIINNNGVPMLYYWDGSTDIREDLMSNEDFLKLLDEKICNTENFGDARISYFYFIYENGKEKCETVSELIQNYVFDSIFYQMSIRYIMHHFNYLYVCSYKENYSFTDNFDADIVNIYDAIKTKYPAKVAKKTVINYVRSELLQTNHLLNNNINRIIIMLENILKDKE